MIGGGTVEKRMQGEWGEYIEVIGSQNGNGWRVSGNLRGFGVKVPKSEGIGIPENRGFDMRWQVTHQRGNGITILGETPPRLRFRGAREQTGFLRRTV